MKFKVVEYLNSTEMVCDSFSAFLSFFLLLSFVFFFLSFFPSFFLSFLLSFFFLSFFGGGGGLRSEEVMHPCKFPNKIVIGTQRDFAPGPPHGVGLNW